MNLLEAALTKFLELMKNVMVFILFDIFDIFD